MRSNRRSRRSIQDRIEDRAVSVAPKRQRPGTHLVENGAKGKQIGPGVEVLASNLLGRHIRDGAHRATGTGERFFGVDGRCAESDASRFEGDLGKSKIKNLRAPAIRDENVGWLDITMNDVLRMSGIQGIGNLNPEIQNRLLFHGLPCNPVPDRRAFQVFHGDEGPAFMIPDLVNSADIGMIQCRRCPRLASKPLRRLRIVGYFVRKELQGDETS